MNNAILDKHGAILVPKLIPIEFCQFFTHVLMRVQHNQDFQGDPQVPDAASIMGKSNSFVFETLQERVWPKIESIVGEELLPTYSYARLYVNGNKLAIHTDREACEISVTVQLGRSHHYAWPIYMGNQRYDLGEGDAVIYKGCEVDHWREECKGPNNYYSGQVFLHYVRKNGEFAEHFKDIPLQGPDRQKIDYTKNRTYLMETK